MFEIKELPDEPQQSDHLDAIKTKFLVELYRIIDRCRQASAGKTSDTDDDSTTG